MLKEICDRCGKEYDENELYKNNVHYGLTLFGGHGHADYINHMRLCDECNEKLAKWIEDGGQDE